MQEKKEIAIELYKIGCLKFGKFKLTSGLESPFYFNLRVLPMYPQVMKKIAKLSLKVLKQENFDVLVGIATGGIPIAAYISCLGEIPMTYIRKEKKKHGLQKLIEADVSEKRVIIVDDVATTGYTLLKAAENVKDSGGIMAACFVIIDREQGAKERLEREGIKFISLLTTSDIIRFLYEEGYVSENTAKEVLDYIRKVRVNE